MTHRLESKVLGVYCIRCALPLEAGGLKSIANASYMFADKTVAATSLVWPASMLAEYRGGIGRGFLYALNPDYNYIYRIDKPLRILERSHAEMLWTLKKGWVDLKVLEMDFPGVPYEEAIKKIDFNDPADSLPHLRYLKAGPILSYYDGIQIEDKLKGHWGEVGVWIDVVKVAAELVDGNVKRFVKESPHKVPDLPDAVVEELVAYTAMAGGRISNATKKWLQENVKPPYSSIKVYRGVKLDEFELDELNKVAKSFLGLSSILDVHRGATVNMSRGRASSWSTTPQVSREFSNTGSFHIMVQAELSPKQIIVDLSLLPMETRHKFRHFSQNEVIAAAGKIPARIISVGIAPMLLVRLGDNPKDKGDPKLQDLAWVPRYGLVKRRDVAAARVIASFLDKM